MIESLCELFPMFTIDELRDHPTNVDHSEDLVTELFDEATALIQSETEKEKKRFTSATIKTIHYKCWNTNISGCCL